MPWRWHSYCPIAAVVVAAVIEPAVAAAVPGNFDDRQADVDQSCCSDVAAAALAAWQGGIDCVGSEFVSLAAGIVVPLWMEKMGWLLSW